MKKFSIPLYVFIPLLFLAGYGVVSFFRIEGFEKAARAANVRAEQVARVNNDLNAENMLLRRKIGWVEGIPLDYDLVK